jgi:hypothetical protein
MKIGSLHAYLSDITSSLAISAGQTVNIISNAIRYGYI